MSWRRSSRSNSTGGECVEIAVYGRVVRMRDSKDPAGTMLYFSIEEMKNFLDGVKTGEFDLPEP